MARKIVINAAATGARGKSRNRDGARKLAASSRKITTMLDGIAKTVEQIAQRRAIIRAHTYLTNPPAEIKAIRDRAAMNAAWRDRAEAERAKLRKMQADADTHYGRNTR